MESTILWLSALLALLGPALTAAAALTAADRLLTPATGLLPRSFWANLGRGAIWWLGVLVTGTLGLTTVFAAYSLMPDDSNRAAGAWLPVALSAVVMVVPIVWAAPLLVRAGSRLSRRQFVVASVLIGLVSLGGALLPLTAAVMLADSAGFFYMP